MLKREKIITQGRWKKIIPVYMIDTTYANNHFLSPTKEIVLKYQTSLSDKAWKEYEKDYLLIIQNRFEQNRELFDDLAIRIRNEDVALGCFCPTKKNPNVYQCHTVLALRFMKEKYPELEIVLHDDIDIEFSVSVPIF